MHRLKLRKGESVVILGLPVQAEGAKDLNRSVAMLYTVVL